VAVIAATLTACGSGSSETRKETWPPLGEPVAVDVDVTAVVDRPVNAGEVIQLNLVGDLASFRGGYYWLVDDSATIVALLRSSQDPEDGGDVVTNPDDWAMAAYGVTGPIDWVSTPVSLIDGPYLVCQIAKASDDSNQCASIEVVSNAN
jgi:hypothetical protein